MISDSVLAYVLIGIGGIALIGFMIVVMVSIKMFRMKLSKEIGKLKKHWQYKPPRPQRIYKIRD